MESSFALDQASFEEAPILVDGRYEVRAELGRGGLAVVYVARDVGLDRDVALKMVAERWLHDEHIVARLQHEARALAAVRSPHVVSVYAFGKHQRSFFIAMERVRGRNLSSLMDKYLAMGAHVPPALAMRLLEPIAAGLSAVHEAGLIHGDVKPDNVLIEDDTGRPVLVDFGLAAPQSEDGGVIGGTPGYMPPEQVGFLDVPVTLRADVYGLACTAFEMFFGKPPFVGKSSLQIAKLQMGKPPSAADMGAPHLAALDPVFQRALRAIPDQRTPTTKKFIEHLKEAMRQLEAPPRPSTMPPESSMIFSESTFSDDTQVVGTLQLSVLVVCADKPSAKLCVTAARVALFGLPVRISMATSKEVAVEKATNHPPDLLIVDYEMPKTDGLSVFSAIADKLTRAELEDDEFVRVNGATAPHAMPRVIVLATAAGLRVSQFRFSVMGVKNFVPKPLALQAVVDTIGQVAESADFRGRFPDAPAEEYLEDAQ